MKFDFDFIREENLSLKTLECPSTHGMLMVF